MPACELRPATQYDTDAVYALICELKQAEFDHHAFRVGFNANLRDPNMRYHLALLDGEVVGMIGLHLQFHLHHVNWIGEIQELVVMPQARARYQSALLPVCLQVSPEILRQRLENRGRENASEINARLARAARYTPQDCHTLNNDGSLRQSVDTLLTLIHQKEKHHACL